MVVKGLDFDNVDLVGILDADGLCILPISGSMKELFN